MAGSNTSNRGGCKKSKSIAELRWEKEKKRKEKKKKRKRKQKRNNLNSTVALQLYNFISSTLFVLFRRHRIFLSQAVEGKIVFCKK